MGNVHFSGRQRDIPSYVLNSQRDNTFEKNNVRFHIDGQYLSDFSDKGIEKFIEKNYNDNTGFLGCMGLGWGGKDLELKEVKAFIQAAAANAENIQGMTFDLTDADLGLFDDDDVSVQDIKHSFEVTYKATQGSSDTAVSFVDATEVRYDHRIARDQENKTHEGFKTEQTTHRGLQKDLHKATRDRDKIASQIGDNAMQKLAEMDSKLEGFDTQVSEIDSDIKNARLRLSQSHIPASEKRELSLMIRGLEAEKKEINSERNDFKKDISKRHGFWSFIGGGSSLEDLRKANQEVKKAQAALDEHKPVLESARTHWQEAVSRREAVERGESLRDLDTPPAAEEPTAPSAEEPTAPPTTDEPIPADGTPTVSPPVAGDSDSPVGETHLQNLLNLPVEARLETLQQIPPEDRQKFLKVADEYLLAGREDNPLGLNQENFTQIAELRDTIAGLRLDALLVWGDESQKEYLAGVDDASKQEILQHLNAQLFNQQLAAQADALRNRLQGTAPEDEVITVDPASPVQPVGETAEAPVVPGKPVTGEQPVSNPAVPPQTDSAPLDFESFGKLPMNEQLARFSELPPADQDLVFSQQISLMKGNILLELAANNMQDQGSLQRLMNLMQPNEKQMVADSYANILSENVGKPYPRKTAMNLLLHLFQEQGIKPGTANAAPAAVPTQPVNPELIEEEPTPVTPGRNSVAPIIEDSEPTAEPIVTTVAPMSPQTPTETINDHASFVDVDQPVAVPPQPEMLAKPQAADQNIVVPSPALEEAAPIQEVAPVSQPPADTGDGLVILQQLLATDPVGGERSKAFAALPLNAKQTVMATLEQEKKVDDQSHELGVMLQAELLAGLEYQNSNDADLSRLISELPATSRQELSDNIQMSLGQVAADTQLPAAQKEPVVASLQNLLAKLKPASVASEPDATPHSAGDQSAAIAQSLKTNPSMSARQQEFANLDSASQKSVFKKLPVTVQGEMLTALVHPHNNDANRQAIIADLDPALKTKLVKNYQEALPAAEAVGEAALAAAIHKVLQEMGASASVQPQAVQPPQAQPQVDAITGAAPIAPKTLEPGRMDMSPQIKQLEQVVGTKTMFGYGGVADKEGMNQLVNQIWGMGSRENRGQMAELMAKNGQSQPIANLLVNGGTEEDEVISTLSRPGFPTKQFMDDVDDSRAYLILRTLAQAAVSSAPKGEKARQVILDAVTAYTGRIRDREAPFERMKNSAIQEGFWEKIPRAVRDKIDQLLK